MNILITGCNGQLGNEMQVLAKKNTTHHYFFTDKILNTDNSTNTAFLDICDENSVRAFIQNNHIDLIVNCAAYTNVDKAEQDAENAHLLNAVAVANLAKTQTKIIHISTDYVFDGQHFVPYSEKDTPSPHTVYGKTKLEGEQQLLQLSPNAIIIRTAWLYSTFGNNFVKTMLRLGKEKETINVVYDQIGSPTYANDLAKFIYTIVNNDQWKAGIYHFSNEGVCSWYDFAQAIFQIKKINCQVKPILSSQYNYNTPRPFYSLLNKQKVKSVWGIEINHWFRALQNCLQIIQT